MGLRKKLKAIQTITGEAPTGDLESFKAWLQVRNNLWRERLTKGELRRALIHDVKNMSLGRRIT